MRRDYLRAELVTVSTSCSSGGQGAREVVPGERSDALLAEKCVPMVRISVIELFAEVPHANDIVGIALARRQKTFLLRMPG